MTDDLQQARISTEVLTNLIEHEYSRHTIPLYGMLDLWTALNGTSHPEFDEFYERYGYAETWARLLAEVRSRATEYRKAVQS